VYDRVVMAESKGQHDGRRAALVGVAMLVAACSEGDEDGGVECPPPITDGGNGVEGAPGLVGTRMLDRSTLQLTFTEPMAPVEDVDPSAFRLSLASSNAGDFPGTHYSDVAMPDGICPPTPTVEECCYYECGPGGCVEKCAPGSVMASVETVCPGATDSTVLTLHLRDAISDVTCQGLSYFEYFNEQYGKDYGGGLFVHYTDNKIPVTDSQGEALGPISEDWVLDAEPYAYALYEAFPNLDPWLPILCPS
jgi:hypothetical protein